MQDNRTLDILKSAILLEKRGRAFYRKVAEQTENEAVRRFFSMMAEEEKQHIRILSEQFKSYQQTSKFLPADYGKDAAGGVAAAVLSSDLREQIQAAGFEAAAVSAAMAMEKNAVALYAKRADESRDAEEQALYRWLSDWEKTHLDFLAAIDREVTEKIWNDNNFWPF